MEKETLEEALEEVARKHANLKEGFDIEEELYYNPSGMNAYKSFIEGAKWQQERMYTYDDIRFIAYNAFCLGQMDNPTENKFNGWIKQFKKKKL